MEVLKKIFVHFRMKKYNHREPAYNEFVEQNHLDFSKKKIVIYSALISDYDSVIEPILFGDNIKYILFTDQKIENSKWKICHIDKCFGNGYNPILLNRYYKMNPFSLFNDYDYAIYIDSNISILSDPKEILRRINLNVGLSFHKHRYRNCIYEEIEACRILKKGNYDNMKKQITKYRKEKFPKNFGMCECGVILFDLKNSFAKKICDEWWDEFCQSDSLRDQLSLPYILWKNNLSIDDVATIGNNLYKNECLFINKNHK